MLKRENTKYALWIPTMM